MIDSLQMVSMVYRLWHLPVKMMTTCKQKIILHVFVERWSLSCWTFWSWLSCGSAHQLLAKTAQQFGNLDLWGVCSLKKFHLNKGQSQILLVAFRCRSIFGSIFFIGVWVGFVNCRERNAERMSNDMALVWQEFSIHFLDGHWSVMPVMCAVSIRSRSHGSCWGFCLWITS